MGSKSSSSSKTTSNFYDQRQVNDAAGGIVGSSNTQDNSISIVATDSGAIQAVQALSLAQSAATDKLGQSAIKLASDAQARAIDTVKASSAGAFDLAKSSATQAYASSGDALAFGREVLGAAGQAVSDAYSSAADSSTGNKTLVYAGLVAVALVGVVVAFGAFRK